jgi:hypothetical protein
MKNLKPFRWTWWSLVMPQNNRPDRWSESTIARSLFCLLGVMFVVVIAMVSADADQAADTDPTSTHQTSADPTSAEVQTTEPQVDSDAKPKFETELIRGKVVWLAAALKSEFGISTVPEVAESSLALLTKDGELLPIVENLRGRAFRKDERLRDREVEILSRRYHDQPLIQVLRLYQFEAGERVEVDYWCDVCAIVMFESGPCSCCQDDNRMRKRPAPKQDSAAK